MTDQQVRNASAKESLGFLAILAGILVVLNILGTFAFARLDCTENDLFSLSDGSRELANNLTDQLEITAYFTDDLPPPFNATERYVRDILSEYRAAGGGRVRVNFITPDTEKEKERAETDGIQRVSHRAIQDDGVTVVEGYRGMVFRYLDKTETIPVIESTSGLEYAITMKLKKLVGEKRKIAALSGHEGPTLAKGLSRLKTCLPTYDFEEVSADAQISQDYKALVLVDPKKALSDTQLRRLDEFVMNGGALGVFGGTMFVDLESGAPKADQGSTAINDLLSKWGITMRQGIVHDPQCAQAPYATNIGRIPVPHPPMPLVSIEEDKAEHPVLFKLQTVPIPFTAPLKVKKNATKGVTTTVLARSSENSWLVTGDPVNLNTRLPQEWTSGGESGPFPLVAAVEGAIPSAFNSDNSSVENSSGISSPAKAKNGRVLVAGTGVFMWDQLLPPSDNSGECALSSNLVLALNAVDWLTQDDDLLAVRAKNVEDPTIKVPHDVQLAEDEARDAAVQANAAAQQGDRQGTEAAVDKQKKALERRKDALGAWRVKKAIYRFGNMLGIPLLFALFGLVRWQIRRSNRKNISL